jgi:hypothetical protein
MEVLPGQNNQNKKSTSLITGATGGARGHGTGHVRLAVTLRRVRRAPDPDAWSARIALTLEVGEQLRELASAASCILPAPPVSQRQDHTELPDRYRLAPRHEESDLATDRRLSEVPREKCQWPGVRGGDM